ncbi:polymer-forming cytoskeletal protein [Herbaspirillum sp. RTI4]|uniref:bactofilin family protein n=1 Tax=Herbaspirillum sp. RTI4 TaxID=3048640 RepID=UPI002AB589B0|nr:polymer-forming cytoskeletal protein [Herbaspirillum sp. RTI4]MDY7577945.1 polymer-forming cytoskeletal protein [Herbaspirillum sp. RTI4]MEA9981609.1 polymer-forming cytoskeletal protein [Herbaspirillum sp. RTI4]
MFRRKSKAVIESLIGISTSIKGDVRFKGGLRIDGHIEGNLCSEVDAASMLVISEHAKIVGDVHAAHLIVNGEIVGDVYSGEFLELQPRARITGNVYYKALEMHGGAIVAGQLSHSLEVVEEVRAIAKNATQSIEQTIEETPMLKLAVSGEA